MGRKTAENPRVASLSDAVAMRRPKATLCQRAQPQPMINTPCPATFTPMYLIGAHQPGAYRLDDLPTQIIDHTQHCRRFSDTNQSWGLHELQGNQIRKTSSQIRMACNLATTVARRCTPLSYRRALKLHADVAAWSAPPPSGRHYDREVPEFSHA